MILIAVLQHYADEIGVYKDRTFIPVLGLEHFEVLLKVPERYGVKHFDIAGIRTVVFKELEAILRKSQGKKAVKIRNATLLTVITPLYQFVNKLPAYTKKTKRLSLPAIATLKALQETVEPDELLFTKLPLACNLPPIGINQTDDGTTAKTLRNKLEEILRAINTAYEELLSECLTLLYSAFGLSSTKEKLRKDLQLRASYVVNNCLEPTLKRFALAAVDNTANEQQWLEAILMIVADKPPESWTDEDVTRFEIKLADLARRFKNLEALQKELITDTYQKEFFKAPEEGNLPLENEHHDNGRFETHRITITSTDGKETHGLVWVNQQQEKEVEEIVTEIVQTLQQHDERVRQAVLAKLSVLLLNPSAQSFNEGENNDKF